MIKQDLLIEIGTEELPPKALSGLSEAFENNLARQLGDAGIAFDAIRRYASPRRLALIVEALASRQDDARITRFGPAVQAAFDANGQPTKAAEGFARSCGVSVDALGRQSDGKVEKLYYESVQEGSSTVSLLPGLIEQALADLPIPRRMRWGSSRAEFVRPVHNLVILYGEELVPATILDVTSTKATFGHRFHYPQAIPLTQPADYLRLLESPGHVVADATERQARIRDQLESIAREHQAQVEIDPALLDEVSSLVEWPVALCGSFDERYLSVPQEALISSLKEHQKCFHLLDAKGNILPRFITVSNLDSRDRAQVIAGNQRVIGPRLEDAAFFYDQDRKQSLASRQDKLKRVIFQQELGTLFDKSTRVTGIARHIAGALGYDESRAERAAQLGKCDLVTSMVYEFTDLQGIMGQYYALSDGEDPEVAAALREQYLPAFAGDRLPESHTGTALALAERIDTITGLFSIGQPPTGSRDPFALRRAALGILRILVEKGLDLDLKSCIHAACQALPGDHDAEAVTQAVMDFIVERFRAWYQDRGIPLSAFLAVDALQPTNPYDADLRVHAVAQFASLPQAEALAAANKRVANILSKLDTVPSAPVSPALLSEAAEKALYEAITARQAQLEQQLSDRNYAGALNDLASLQEPVDAFFDQVMVNTEDAAVRANRQALLYSLRRLFLSIADISCLQGQPA